MERKLRARGLLILLLLLAILAPCLACAEGSGELAFFVDGANSQPELINFKGKLNEYGFYVSGIGEDMLRNGEVLDGATMAAVQKVHELNPDLPYSDQGVCIELYWRVMGFNNDGKALVTPLCEPVVQYKLLEPGVSDPAVGELQMRLSNLGYDEEAGFRYTSELFDDELGRAVAAFVKENNFYGYDAEDGVTAELQELIFSQDAAAYTPEKGTLFQRVMGFLTDGSPILGFEIPNAALLALGFALLCVIVVLVLRLVSPGKPGASGPQLRFQVEFEGEETSYVLPMAPVIEIGRSVGSFPLNMRDDSISRRHCEIHCDKGRMTLVDHSSFGTKVNGELCHEAERPLRSGDQLEVGKHKITVRIEK